MQLVIYGKKVLKYIPQNFYSSILSAGNKARVFSLEVRNARDIVNISLFLNVNIMQHQECLVVPEKLVYQIKFSMEQNALKNVNHCLNTNIYSYLWTFFGHSSNLYLNFVIFSTPLLIRHLWQLETVVFLHWCLICALLLPRLVMFEFV